MTYQTFTGDALARRRYWARSHVGWRMIARAAPNAGHRAVADLQRAGVVSARGHAERRRAAPGRRRRAPWSSCTATSSGWSASTAPACPARAELDQRLRLANPGFDARAAAVNPDGDVDLADDDVAAFVPVDCTACTGMLKPDVVFFGESVPMPRVEAAFAAVESARALLVLGSSLTVMSGRRFVLRAAKLGIPVAIVNQGETRGDPYAAVRVDAPLGEVLPAAVRGLGLVSA